MHKTYARSKHNSYVYNNSFLSKVRNFGVFLIFTMDETIRKLYLFDVMLCTLEIQSIYNIISYIVIAHQQDQAIFYTLLEITMYIVMYSKLLACV